MALSVIVVEDDAVLRELLSRHLMAAGHDVRALARGDLVLHECANAAPDIVVLDLSLPGMSGLDVCAALRRTLRPSPGVVVVTARASEADVILGFDKGADDYVVKPCRPREVVARVAALARRMYPADHEREREVLVRGALSIDVAAMRARVGARELDLTPTEHALLALLAREEGVVHSRKSLLQAVWSTSHPGYSRNVDCHVARLRRKLEAAGLTSSPIETVHGAGYRFREAV